MRFLLCVLALFPTLAWSAPHLNFSDIDSGPKSGNTDGIGSGAIVTIWGHGLGASQGTSKVYVGNVAATAVYYWKDADGTLPGGPAELSTYHKMQEIAFSVPPGAADGANTIKVVVGGVESNTLPFTVRAGNIYFIKDTGNDTTGNGSWSAPWRTLDNVMSGNGKVVAGDTVYSVGVGSTSGMVVGTTGGGIQGTAENPVSLIAYPNTTLAISGFSAAGPGTYAIFNYNHDIASASKYINLSKLKVTVGITAAGVSNGIRAFQGNRLVGLEITGPTAYGGTSGAIGGNKAAAGGGKYFGIYIHHYGTANGVASVGNTGTDPNTCAYTNPACMSSWDVYQHLYYLSNRYAGQIEAYEIGWNHLADNPIYQGIHLYDEASAGGWTGTMKFHHNVVKNQRGGAIELDLPTQLTVPIEVTDNLVISDQDDVYNLRAFQLLARGSAVKVYNNTVYGYNSPNVIANGSTDYRNNIMVDTKGVVFTSNTPTAQSDNLFFSTGATAAPTWATAGTGNINANPLFMNVAANDFSLQSGSPALDTGYDTTATAPVDFLGTLRTAAPSIGAFGAGTGEPPVPPTVTRSALRGTLRGLIR